MQFEESSEEDDEDAYGEVGSYVVYVNVFVYNFFYVIIISAERFLPISAIQLALRLGLRMIFTKKEMLIIKYVFFFFRNF